jgi:hypothetical protein
MKVALAILVLVFVAFGCRVQSKSTEAGTSGSRLPVGKAPSSVILRDVSADGKLDLIVANEGDNTVTVLLADGKGSFTPAPGSPFPAGNSPNDIAAGDLNGDGKPDLAFANHETKYVTVLLGDGGGRFSPAPGSPFAVNSRPHPHGIAFADFNGDHNLDFVVDDWGNDRVTVLFGDGKGRFASPGVSFTVGKMPYQRVRSADLNSDGHADIVTTNTEGGDITVLLGDGKGGFNQSAGSPVATSPRPFAVTIGDVNGDGIPDLVSAHYSGNLTDPGDDAINVLLGVSDGKFKAAPGSPFKVGDQPSSIAIGDLNSDGKADIVTANEKSNDLSILLSK